MHYNIPFLCLASMSFCVNASSGIFIELKSQPYSPLPRFWAGAGFSPSAPIPVNRSAIALQLESNDIHRNMEYVSALPNSGIKYIRIHWLLSLIVMKGIDVRHLPVYDFTAFDSFLDHLLSINLLPVIEFMGKVFPKSDFYDTQFLWKDFAYQLTSRFLSRYGQKMLLNFRFELWNEPDLRTYNILNYTLTEYMEYTNGVASGLRATARRMNPVSKIALRGPAGLFKSTRNHHFCFGLLAKCNDNLTDCPIDVITFHRKGINSSEDILNETVKLLKLFSEKYPRLKHLPYANSEADPTSGWSKNVSMYADVRYAHELVSIVLQHWNAILIGQLSGLESISHDNAFLSYHPFEFEQRTMLARFAMNNTKTQTIHFIQKPVYAALGLLGSLASTANKMETKENISYVLTLGKNYAAAILMSNKNIEHMANLEVELNLKKWKNSSEASFGYLAEFLDQKRTNPFSVWTHYDRPAYPNDTVLHEMMRAQGPHILQHPKIVTKPNIKLNARLSPPWIILVRICASTISPPSKVTDVRIHPIDESKVLIRWNEYAYSNNERCVQTYEIFYSPSFNGTCLDQWQLITENENVPFLLYYHHISRPNMYLNGCYKIRAMDIFGRFGEFSEICRYGTAI